MTVSNKSHEGKKKEEGRNGGGGGKIERKLYLQIFNLQSRE
jgi:hypothetical protein